ncbi:MAG: hypothetical protein Q8R26_02350 [bacterium]|nr:hypothetical protein [bacterium]
MIIAKVLHVIKIKNIRELTFLVIGILIVVILASVVVFALWFIARELTLVLNVDDSAGASSLRFEIEKAESLRKK